MNKINGRKPLRRYSNCSQSQIAMNYSTFEAHYLQQNQKRKNTTSSHKQRYYSDLESDAGSDGLAVNSGGSGRSGDWVSSRNQSKRLNKRCISTDSGVSSYITDSGGSFISSHKVDSGASFISSHKADSGDSLSNFSSSNSSRKSKFEKEKAEEKEFNYIPTAQPNLMRSNSCSAIIQNAAPLQQSSNENSKILSPEIFKIELKQKEILEQCYRNEILKDNMNNPSIIDCSLNERISKIQLPEKLNYPLSKYRYKSENSISKTSVKPLQKLRNGFKKIKVKKTKENEEINSSIPSDMSYMEYAYVNENDSDKILSRLSTNPSKKTFIRKIFNKLGGRSYSIQKLNRLGYQNISQVKDASTRSIPDTISTSLRKEQQGNDTIEPSQPAMTKTQSMPSIACHFMQDSRHNDSVLVHYPPLDSSLQVNQISKNNDRKITYRTENTRVINNQNSRTFSAATSDDLTYKKQFFNPKLAYAHHFTRLPGTPIVRPLPGTPIVRPLLGTPIVRPIFGTPIAHPQQNFNYLQNYQMYHQQQLQKSCNGSYFINPTVDPRIIQQRPQYCPCCHYSGEQPRELKKFHDQPMQEYIVAPLSVKMNNEKRAERKKVADVIFDTFV